MRGCAARQRGRSTGLQRNRKWSERELPLCVGSARDSCNSLSRQRARCQESGAAPADNIARKNKPQDHAAVALAGPAPLVPFARGSNGHRQRTRPQLSRQHQRQCRRPHRSRQHRRHPTSTTSPLRALSTLFDGGTTCIAGALVAPATARTNPARTIAIVVFAMMRLSLCASLCLDDNTAQDRVQSASGSRRPRVLLLLATPRDRAARQRRGDRLEGRGRDGDANHGAGALAPSGSRL